MRKAKARRGFSSVSIRLVASSTPLQRPAVGLHQVAERMQVDAHGLKARLAEHPEVLVLKAGLVARSPDRIVADDIHAPAYRVRRQPAASATSAVWPL